MKTKEKVQTAIAVDFQKMFIFLAATAVTVVFALLTLVFAAGEAYVSLGVLALAGSGIWMYARKCIRSLETTKPTFTQSEWNEWRGKTLGEIFDIKSK